MTLTIKQLEQRKSGIGGSDVFTILGQSPWKTPLELYNEKIGITDSPQIESEVMEWGNRLEAPILKAYEDKTGSKVSEFDTIIDNKYPFLLANVDGFVKDKNLVVEAKTSCRFSDWGEPGSNEIPMQYMCQVAHYCSVLKADGADIAVLLGGNKFVIYHYKSNKALEERLRERCVRFWKEHVLKRIPPPYASDAEKISVLYGCDSGENIVANDEVMSVLDDISNAMHEKKVAAKAEDDAKNKLKLFMKNNSTLTDASGNYLATWKAYKKRSTDQKKLKKDYPEVFKNCSKNSECRRINIKQLGEL